MKTKSFLLSVALTISVNLLIAQTTKSLEQTLENCVEEVLKHHKCIDECTEKMHVFKDGLTLDCADMDAAIACFQEDLEEIEKLIQGIDLDKLMKEADRAIQQAQNALQDIDFDSLMKEAEKSIQEANKALQEMNDCLNEKKK